MRTKKKLEEIKSFEKDLESKPMHIQPMGTLKVELSKFSCTFVFQG